MTGHKVAFLSLDGAIRMTRSRIPSAISRALDQARGDRLRVWTGWPDYITHVAD